MSLPARSRHALMVVAIIGSALGWVSGASAATPRVTVIGDSVQASFGFVPQAVRSLASPGLSVRMEASACRKLSAPGCLGGSPESATAIARALGPRLGDVVVVHIGYNDTAARYDIGAALRAFRRAGVRAVVWVTLRDPDGSYAATNSLIRNAAHRAGRGRLPVVRVFDWNTASAGRPWFASDGLHLNATGALGLSRLLRENVLAALADVGTSVDGRPVTTRADAYPLGRSVDQIAGEGGVLWTAGAGRLGSLDEAAGRRSERLTGLAASEDLASGGRRTWLRDRTTGVLTEPRARAAGVPGRVIEGVGAPPLLADAGLWLWAVAECHALDSACAAAQSLRGIHLENGQRRDLPLTFGRVVSVAADERALWILIRGSGGRARIERRNPASGDLMRSSRLPDKAASGTVVAGRRGAWVLAGNGQLVGIARNGRLSKGPSRLAAIAAVDDQLWAVKADRRTILSLNPISGEVRGQARFTRRLSGRMSFTDRYLWVLSASRRQAIRIGRS